MESVRRGACRDDADLSANAAAWGVHRYAGDLRDRRGARASAREREFSGGDSDALDFVLCDTRADEQSLFVLGGGVGAIVDDGGVDGHDAAGGAVVDREPGDDGG